MSNPRQEGWNLTQEAFSHLLALLDPDPENAGRKYERLRRKLIRFFDWEGCTDPEQVTDETINRVARRISEGEDIRSLRAYLFGTARFVLLETNRKQQREGAFNSQVELTRAGESSTGNLVEKRRKCLDRCLATLHPESRNLIVRYYEGESRLRIENRRKLARELELTVNALRNRALRIRDRLEGCVRGCVGS